MYRALWALFRPYRFILAFAVILQAIAGISSLVPWIAISQIATVPTDQYFNWIIIAFIGGLIWLIGQTLALYLTHQTDNRLCYHLRLKLLNKLSKLPLNYFIQQGKNGIQQVIDRDVRALHQLTAHAPADIAQLIVVPITAAAILFFHNSLLLLFCLLPLAASIYLFKMMRSPRYQALYSARNETMSHLYEHYTELADNPLLARQFPEKSIQKTVTLALLSFDQAFKRWISKIGALSSLTQLGISTTLLSLWVILGAWILPEPTSLAQIILFILLMHSIAAPVAAMGHGSDALNLAISASQRIEQLLELPEMQYGEKTLNGEACDLRIEHLNYVLQGKSLLLDINLGIQQGEFVAIVGASGAGKSTLLQLMARFLDPTHGNISLKNINVDDIPLPQLSLTGLNQQISIVTQNTQPMPCSLRDNLQLFSPHSTTEDIFYYLDALNLLSILEQQPKGIDSIIGSNINLSGGEAQRLAIARTLLSTAPILLFDEPTSALDPQNSQQVLTLLEADKRTRVLVTHDLNCLNQVSKVFLLDKGELIAQGTHQQLSEHCLQYQLFLSALEENK